MQQQTEIFVPKSLAMELRKKGFNEMCVGLYFAYHADEIVSPKIRDKYVTNSSLNSVDSCTAPTYDQVVGWFAEKHGIDISAKRQISSWEYEMLLIHEEDENEIEYKHKDIEQYQSRQQSLLTAFEEALKLI